MEANQIINRSARFNLTAAISAGLVSGAVLWLFSHGTPWFTSGMVSPTLMGRDLKPAGAVDGFSSTLTVLAQLVVAVGYTLIIAAVVSRLRGMWAAALGGVVGLGLYVLNFLVFHFLLTVDWTGTEVPVIVTHVVFGMVAAGIYKGLAARRDAVPQRS